MAFKLKGPSMSITYGGESVQKHKSNLMKVNPIADRASHGPAKSMGPAETDAEKKARLANEKLVKSEVSKKDNPGTFQGTTTTRTSTFESTNKGEKVKKTKEGDAAYAKLTQAQKDAQDKKYKDSKSSRKETLTYKTKGVDTSSSKPKAEALTTKQKGKDELSPEAAKIKRANDRKERARINTEYNKSKKGKKAKRKRNRKKAVKAIKSILPSFKGKNNSGGKGKTSVKCGGKRCKR
tara:strand:+ start:25 stop:735 length:711 start_codon:yes stop_codon:yes gene_type:complete